jgi:acetoin utilization deacetylase AcuC-like enzyme
MKLGYYSYTSHLEHDVGDIHPEHPMRVIAINHQLECMGILHGAHLGSCHQVQRQDLVRGLCRSVRTNEPD